MTPDEKFAKLTSGDFATIMSTSADLYDAAVDIDEGAADVVVGLRGATWEQEGLMVTKLQMLGYQIFISSAVASWRTYRAADEIALVGAAYQRAVNRARPSVRSWNQRPLVLSPEAMEQMRVFLNAAIDAAIRPYVSQLEASAQALQGKDPEYELQLSRWLVDGAFRDYLLYLRTGARRGPRIPDTAINGNDDGWIPQGLAHDGKGYVGTSYRHGEDGDDSLFTFYDDHGDEAKNVHLLGPGGGDAPTHSGGVAVSGDDVYVVSSEDGGSYVYRYSLAELRAARNGGEVPAKTKVRVPASSYVTTDAAGNIYLGDHNSDEDGRLYRYRPGQLREDDPNGDNASGDYPTPPNVNGAAVVVPPVGSNPGEFLYTRQEGRDSDGQIVYQDGDGNELSPPTDSSGMIQNIVVVDGVVTVQTEAGGELYSPWDVDHGEGDGGTDDPGKLWGQTHMLQYDLGQLTAGSFVARPPSLKEAARDFARANRSLDRAGRTVKGLQLPNWSLGEVTNTTWFASVVNSHMDLTGQSLDTAVSGSDQTTTGLIAAARLFSDTDAEEWREYQQTQHELEETSENAEL